MRTDAAMRPPSPAADGPPAEVAPPTHAPQPPPPPPPSPPLSPSSTASPHQLPSILRCPPCVRLPRSVRIVEVSPRDGLQNERVMLASDVKVRLVHDLVDAGLSCVEVTAFVSPKWVPQLADAANVFSAVRRKRNVTYPVLAPNARGLANALAVGAEDVSIFVSATESFSRRNLNCSVESSLDRYAAVLKTAAANAIRVRAYISCSVGCPYEGFVSPQAVAQLAVRLRNMGCYEISLADTIGVGNPVSVVNVIDACTLAGVPISALAIHCHDTRGTALANVVAAMSRGVCVVDSSVAGLGGCPFAPGAAGNLATEDLVSMLRGMGVDVGPVRLDRLIDIGNGICKLLERGTSSRVAIAAAGAASSHAKSAEHVNHGSN